MSNDPNVIGGAGTNKGGGSALGLSIAGLVIGSLSMLLSFVPCFGAYAFWPGLLATLLSVLGLMKSDSKTIPIIALCVSLVSVGMGYYWMNLVEKAVDEGKKELNQLEKDLNKAAEDARKRREALEKNGKVD